jgi:hypothetical protein
MPAKTMRVRVNTRATVSYEGCCRRKLPHGVAVTIPCTAYYLRLLHQGSIVRDVGDDLVTVASGRGKVTTDE